MGLEDDDDFGGILHAAIRHASPLRPFGAAIGSEGRGHVPLRPTSSAVLRAVYEFQSGPRFIHGTALHVDEAVGQGDGAYDILGKVGRDSGCTFRPGDPEASIWRESFFPRQEPSGQVCVSPNERVDHVDAAVLLLADRHEVRESTQEPLVSFRRMDDEHREALFDAEFLRQRFRRRTGGHRRGPAPPPPRPFFFPVASGSRGAGLFPFPLATAIATSLPMTVTPTCMTASGITGLTFPGMIEEPG